MIESFKIVQGEVDNAINIMQEVAQWVRNIGLNTWKPDDLNRDKLLVGPGLKEDNFCVGKIEDNNASCMILQWSDQLFWPEKKENESGYIHKLCVRRQYAGMRLSEKMVEFAINECKIRSIQFLRLDTGWNNRKLCNLYESLGFEKVGKKMFRNREFALYEMRIDLE